MNKVLQSFNSSGTEISKKIFSTKFMMSPQHHITFNLVERRNFTLFFAVPGSLTIPLKNDLFN